MEPFIVGEHVEGASADRRWYPPGDCGEWERTTRRSIFEAVRQCVSHAIYSSLSTEIRPHELHASDTVFRELHVCAQAYSRALFDLGQTPDEAAAVVIAAAREAAEPKALHPSIVSALEQWCHEAHAVSS